jgi:hypothetical protein
LAGKLNYEGLKGAGSIELQGHYAVIVIYLSIIDKILKAIYDGGTISEYPLWSLDERNPATNQALHFVQKGKAYTRLVLGKPSH